MTLNLNGLADQSKGKVDDDIEDLKGWNRDTLIVDSD